MRTRLLLTLLGLLLLAPSAAEARRSVPFGWVGVTIDGPLLSPTIDGGAEAALMADAGAESARAVFFWNQAQPYPNAGSVPPGSEGAYRDVNGVPTDFRVTDAIVGNAARRGIRVMPVTVSTPRWAAVRPADGTASPPRAFHYANYLRALVARYGPSGSFWAENPGVPRIAVRDWQIWNEVSLRAFWSIQPFARGYVYLLRAARTAIRRADPGAKIVLAGFPNFSWRELAKVYAAGGRFQFDMAAVHPYTYLVRNVLRIVELNRQTMSRYRDFAKPLVVSELSWSSGRGRVRESTGFPTLTESGQAARVAEALPALARARLRFRLARIYWYTWMSPPLGSPNAFDYSGLRRFDGTRVVTKPAFFAFRRVAAGLNGCYKAGTATRCR